MPEEIIKEEAAVVKEEKPKAASKKKIEVDADVLKGLLDRVNELESKTSQIEQTASQDQIRKIEALRAQGKLVKSVKLRRFDGDIVLGWKVIEDRVWVSDGKLNEIQTLEIYLQNGGTKQTTLLQFGRGCLYETYEVIKEARTGSGDIEFTLMLGDGQEIIVNSKYVN